MATRAQPSRPKRGFCLNPVLRGYAIASFGERRTRTRSAKPANRPRSKALRESHLPMFPSTVHRIARMTGGGPLKCPRLVFLAYVLCWMGYG